MNLKIKQYFDNGKLPTKKIDKLIDWDAVVKHLDETKPTNWQNYHIDHIISLSKFDLTDHKQLKFANSPENLQWLTASENLKKGNRDK